MGRSKTLATPEVGERASAELARAADAALHVRLLAVAKACTLPLREVAVFLGVAPDTVRRWVKRFAEEGRAGLRDKPRGHNPSKLSPRQLDRVAAWLETGRDEDGAFVHWTIPLLREEIARRFGVRLGLTPLRGHVRRLGFKLKVPRPAHAQADPAAREAFKKKRRAISPRFQTGPATS